MRSARALTPLIVLGGILLIPALRGVRGQLDPIVGILSVGGFLACLLLAALIAHGSRRRILADRERLSRGTMLVTMAQMLNKESDETLERIAGRGGPAAEAASMLLERRKSGVFKRAGTEAGEG